MLPNTFNPGPRKKCMHCDEQFKNDELAFEYYSGHYKSKVNTRAVCVNCHFTVVQDFIKNLEKKETKEKTVNGLLDLVVQMTGNKYVKKKKYEEIISRKVAEKV